MFMGMWFVALVAVVAVAVVVAAGSRSGDDDTDAIALLDRRLASGDLTAEEHAERRGVLMQTRAGTSRPQTWAVPVTVIVLVVVVVIAAAAATSAGSWRGPHGGGWMGGHMGTGGSTGASAQTVADGRTVEIEAGDLWFAPDTIEVVAGQPINIELVNTGQVFHDLTVPAADLVISAESGDEISGGLALADPGTYEFLCSVPGHAQAGMRGTIVVTEG